MTTIRYLRPAALAIACAASLAMSGVAGATVAVDAHGAWVDGPEAPASARQSVRSDRTRGTAVLAEDKRETNLRKSHGFVTVLGVASLR